MTRGSKWLLMVIMTMVTIINLGIVFAIATLFIAMMDIFQTDRATTATVQSLLMGVTFGFGVFSGILISKLGFPKVTFISGVLVTFGFSVSFISTNIYYLYVSIGIVSATGISLSFITCLTLAGQIFIGTQRLVCVSILNTAIAVGAVMYPYLLDWIKGTYGVFGTFLIVGGLTSNTFVLFTVCYVNNATISKMLEKTNANDVVTITDEEHNNDHANSNNIDKIIYIKELFKLPFVCLLIATGSAVSALNGYIGLMLDIAVWKGFSERQGLNVIIAFNVLSLISRVIPVILKHKTGVSIFVCIIFAASSGGTGQILLYTAPSYILYMVGTSLCGLALGGILSSALVIIVKIVRQDQKPVAIGMLYTTIGLLTTATGALLGKFRDIQGSYAGAIWTIAGIQYSAAALYFVAYKFRSRKTSLKKTSISIEVAVVSESNCDL